MLIEVTGRGNQTRKMSLAGSIFVNLTLALNTFVFGILHMFAFNSNDSSHIFFGGINQQFFGNVLQDIGDTKLLKLVLLWSVSLLTPPCCAWDSCRINFFGLVWRDFATFLRNSWATRTHEARSPTTIFNESSWLFSTSRSPDTRHGFRQRDSTEKAWYYSTCFAVALSHPLHSFGDWFRPRCIKAMIPRVLKSVDHCQLTLQSHRDSKQKWNFYSSSVAFSYRAC